MPARRVVLLIAALLLALPLARADELQPMRVAIGLSLPPYVMADERRGMEYDIVREALADAGFELVPVFVDFGEVPGAIASGKADAAMTVTAATVPDHPLSAPHIVYRNAAMTLASRHLTVETIADLSGFSVLAFQKATDYLPAAYAEAVAGKADYSETAEQVRQPEALFLGEVEVVVADINIFNWFRNDPRVRADADSTQEVTVHAIFAPTPYQVAFGDAADRDAFDAALAALRDSGRYGAIIAAYGGVE